MLPNCCKDCAEHFRYFLQCHFHLKHLCFNLVNVIKYRGLSRSQGPARQSLVDKLGMKNLKIILVVVVSMFISLEAFADTVDSQGPARENVEMTAVELEVQNNIDEGVFEEDLSIDITNQDLEDVLNDAYASR